MYLENKSTLDLELSQAATQVHQRRNSLRTSDAVAGNFSELRLLEGFSGRKEAQKLQQAAAAMPLGNCVIHAKGFGPVHQENG